MFLVEVRLPDGNSGRLFRSAMPGNAASLATDAAEIISAGVSRVICLATSIELQVQSPEYGQAIENRSFDCRVDCEAMQDYGIPENDGFPRKLKEVAHLLRHGQSVLVHCRAGVGRTSVFCICLLKEMGCEMDEAERRVIASGAHPESKEQWELVRNYAPK